MTHYVWLNLAVNNELGIFDNACYRVIYGDEKIMLDSPIGIEADWQTSSKLTIGEIELEVFDMQPWWGSWLYHGVLVDLDTGLKLKEYLRSQGWDLLAGNDLEG